MIEIIQEMTNIEFKPKDENIGITLNMLKQISKIGDNIVSDECDMIEKEIDEFFKSDTKGNLSELCSKLTDAKIRAEQGYMFHLQMNDKPDEYVYSFWAPRKAPDSEIDYIVNKIKSICGMELDINIDTF